MKKVKNLLLVIILGGLLSPIGLLNLIPVHAKPAYADIDGVELVRILDGDTIVVNINGIPDVFGKEISVRINGIDTPEKRSKNPAEKAMALKAKQRLEQLITGQKIELKNVNRDKYFRLLADVYSGGVSVGDTLIKEGLARPYHGGKKEKWVF